MARTARDIINSALRLIGVLATSETASAAEASDALDVLNDMVDSWSTESLLIPSRAIEPFSLVPSQSSYTFGTGGNWNSTRPQKIEMAGIINSNGTEIPMDIFNEQEWANIRLKSTTSSLPQKLFAEGTFPLDIVHIYPVPQIALQINLYSWKPLTSFASLTTSVNLPPGYNKALRYNLAIELAPEYGKSAAPEIIASAVDAKDNIKRMNIKPLYLSTDPAVRTTGKAFNWLTGE